MFYELRIIGFSIFLITIGSLLKVQYGIIIISAPFLLNRPGCVQAPGIIADFQGGAELDFVSKNKAKSVMLAPGLMGARLSGSKNIVLDKKER